MGLASRSDKEFTPLEMAEMAGVVSIMAYIGSYAYPDRNLCEFRQVLMLALEFLKPKSDIELIVNRATDNAEVFRRPWTEEPPRDQNFRTI